MKSRITSMMLTVLFLALVSSCIGGDPGRFFVNSPKELKSSDPITLRFSNVLADKSNAEIVNAAQKAVTITPNVAFDTEVLDQQTLCIYPREPLDYNTSYKVSVKMNALTGEAGKGSFTFKTLPPVIVFDCSQLLVDPEKEGVYHLDVLMTSSDPLDEKYLESGMKTKGFHPTVEWEHSEDGLMHMVRFDGIEAASKAGDFTIEYSYPKYSAEGERKYTVPAEGVFTVMSAEAFAEPYSFEFSFSAMLDKNQSFDELVSMPGAGKLSFNVVNNVLTVKPAIRAKDRQFVSISKGVESRGGARLEEDYERYFAIPTGEPALKFLSDGSILPSAGMGLAFQSINYTEVEVRVHQIYENNVLQFLQSNNLNSHESYTTYVANQVLDTVLVLGDVNSPKLRNLNTYGLDLTNLVKVQKGAIYKVEIKGLGALSEFEEERWDSDYYFGSWKDYEDRVRNVLVSDLNIIAKSSDDNGYTIYVTDILSGAPVNNAKVKVYDRVKQVLAEGSTGSDGQFSCNTGDRSVATVVASSGNDKSYLSLSNGSSISLSNFDVGGNASRGGQKGYIFGERGVWRPGDNIYITFVSMLDKGVLPANHPVTAVLSNPQGQTMQTLVSSNGCDGMYSFKFTTAQNAPTGNWEVKVTAGGQSYYKTVKIETVKPNNIVIDMKLDMDKVVPVSNVAGYVEAKWLVGNPAKGLETKMDVALSKGHTEFDGYKDYIFEDGSRQFSTDEMDFFKGVTDDNGKLSFARAYKNMGTVPGFLNAVFTTRVFEKGGDFSIDRYSTTLSPYDTYVGLNVKQEETEWGSEYLDGNKTHTFKIAAVDFKGRPVSKTVNAEVEVYRMGWSWWWSSNGSGLASYAKDSYETPYKTFNTVVSGGKGDFKLDFSDQESGYFFVRVTDVAGGHAAAQVVRVTRPGYDWGEGSPDAVAQLQTTLDKDKYTVGEKAQLSIPSTSGARALVSLEKGNNVIKTFWIDCKGDKTVIPIDIESGMSPNIYASVMLIQPYNNSKNDAPVRMFGVQRIKVEDAATHLNPVIDIPAEIRPESEVTVNVREQNGRPMSYVIALVDEGLLSLTRFKTPNPWDSFYATEALGIRTWDLFDLVIGAYGARMEQMFAIGGDGENVMVTPNTQAERFKPVSMFLGPFTIKAKGTGKHTFQMPQYIGNVRAMVISTDGKAMGSAQKNVSVTKPVMVQTTLPRVIGTDEEVTVPVTVFTTKDNIGNVSVELSVSAPLEVVGQGTASVNSQKAGEEVVYFTVKASSEEGIGKVKAVAKGAGDSSTQDLEIDVRDPNPMTTNSKVVFVEGGKSAKIDFALAGKPGTSKVTVEASSLPPIDLDYRLEYLTSYPHGCVEQTVSAVFPQLYLSDLVDTKDKGLEKCEDNVKAAIAKLPSFAISSGGMTYWPGTSSYAGASVWGSIYATHFMVEAQAKGYSVPVSLKKANINYLKSIAASKNNDAESRAYACYVLARAGSAPRGDMNRLREDVASIPAPASWFLAAAYAVDGKKDAANDVIKKMANAPDKFDPFSYSFGSEDRLVAVQAMTYRLLGDKVNAFKGVEKLSNWLNSRDHYMSTQSTAWALNAVADYAKQYGEGGLDVTVTAAGEKMTLKSDKIAKANVAPGDGTSLPFEVVNNSKAPAYVVVSSRGIPDKGQEVAASNGIKLEVKYTLPDGTPMDPTSVEQGTDFVVNLYVTNLSTTTDYHNIAISQIFPSGWEIRVDRIDGFYQDFRDDRVYSYLYMEHQRYYVLKTRVTATYKGRFYLPATTCEAMYDNSINASTVGGWVVVK